MRSCGIHQRAISHNILPYKYMNTWWRHQMETFSALLAICAGNSPVSGDFPTQRPVTRSFDVYFDLRLNKRLCKQSWAWWFETLLCPLWRHSNEKNWLDVECGKRPAIIWTNSDQSSVGRHQYIQQKSSLIARFMGANMGLIWGRQDPGGPHVGPMSFAIWDALCLN